MIMSATIFPLKLGESTTMLFIKLRIWRNLLSFLARLAAHTFVNTYKNRCKRHKIRTISEYCCTYQMIHCPCGPCIVWHVQQDFVNKQNPSAHIKQYIGHVGHVWFDMCSKFLALSKYFCTYQKEYRIRRVHTENFLYKSREAISGRTFYKEDNKSISNFLKAKTKRRFLFWVHFHHGIFIL